MNAWRWLVAVLLLAEVQAAPPATEKCTVGAAPAWVQPQSVPAATTNREVASDGVAYLLVDQQVHLAAGGASSSTITLPGSSGLPAA